MSNALKDYYAALERLKQRKARINNDAVAVEAGRKKGSIKKSRSQFADLIVAIDEASQSVSRATNATAERLNRVTQTSQELQDRLDAALVRELSLLQEVFELRKELAQLRGGNVLPLRRSFQKADAP